MNEPVIPAENPYAAPKAELQDIPVLSSQGVELASRWRRLGGVLIDFVTLFALVMLIATLVSGTAPGDLLEQIGSERMQMLWMLPVVLVSWFAVAGYLLVTRGQLWASCCSGCGSFVLMARKPQRAGW